MAPAGVFTEEGAHSWGQYLPRVQCPAVPWHRPHYPSLLLPLETTSPQRATLVPGLAGPQRDLLRSPSESQPMSPWII